ncbi:MAG: hypothetical protein JO022_02960, partial [Acidobacteriaceae bacterium]|nr:hypothetical protein [Acidobacteriaceae bacterium]
CFRLPQSRATAGFILSVLSRGRQQKLVFLLIFGIGVALVLESSVYASMHPERIQVRGAPAGFESSIVSLPLTLSFFAMIGMRRVFRLPSELPANWIFRFTEQPELRRSQLDTVFRTLVFWGGLPVLLVCAPAQFAVFGPRAVWALLMQALLMLALAEHLLQGWRSIPFTCQQNPARRHLMLSASVHILELALYSFMSSNFITAGLHDPGTYRNYFIFVLAVFIYLRRKRLREWGAAPLEFQESLTPDVQPLNLIVH